MHRILLTAWAIGMAVVAVYGTTSRAVAGDDSDADLREVMRLWCTQAGTWTGTIDVTGSDGKVQRMELVTTHDCTESARHHIVRERFGADLSTVKVTFIDAVARAFQTSYFAGGKESLYRFVYVSALAKDDRHWKTIIASPPGSETYEGRQATLRYIRVRDGDTVTSWKDVQFVDGEQDFEPRSKIVQTLRP
jgi:hypothetical protein